MPTKIPGGLRYSPAELGFNALVIAASGNTNGNIVPWATGFRFSAVTCIVNLASAVINGDLRVRIFDFDGQTEISDPAVPLSIVTGMNNLMVMSHHGLDTPRSSVGATPVAAIPSVLGSPFVRFNVRNADGVNALTVTLNVILHERVSNE